MIKIYFHMEKTKHSEKKRGRARVVAFYCMMMAMYGRQFAWLLPTVFLLLSTSMWTSRVDAASNITNVTCFSSNECVNVPGRSVCLKPECISMNNPAVLGYCAQCNPCMV